MIASPIIVMSIFLICWGVCKIFGKDEAAKEIEQVAQDYKETKARGCGCFTWFFIILIGCSIISLFRLIGDTIIGIFRG